MQIGEGFAGTGVNAAHVNTVLGPKEGPVGHAWTTALATPRLGHAPFVVVVKPNVPVKPFTLFVNKSALASKEHAELTWGAAQAGVAAGVLDAVAGGVIAQEIADQAVVIAAVWVDPGATPIHQDAIFINNRVATMTALTAGASGRPTAYEVLEDDGGFWNPFFEP